MTNESTKLNEQALEAAIEAFQAAHRSMMRYEYDLPKMVGDAIQAYLSALPQSTAQGEEEYCRLRDYIINDFIPNIHQYQDTMGDNEDDILEHIKELESETEANLPPQPIQSPPLKDTVQGDYKALADKLAGLMIKSGQHDRCNPPNYYVDPLIEIIGEEGIAQIINALAGINSKGEV